MNLPPATATYDQANETSARNAIKAADDQNVKKGQELNPVRFVLTDTVTGLRYLVTIASGALTLTLTA